jgi:N-methylhydantoinase A
MPGNFSAFGLLVADVRRDFVRTRVSAVDSLSPADIREMLGWLIADGERELRTAGFSPDRQRFAASLDMRYAGQSFELSVPVEADLSDMAKVVQGFETVYRTRYGGTTTARIEIVSYRVAAWGLSDKPALPTVDGNAGTIEASRRGLRSVVFDGEAHPTPVLDRERLPPEIAVVGPVIIEEPGSSTVVPPHWSVERDWIGCLVLRRGASVQ